MNAIPAYKPTTAKVIELSKVMKVMDSKKKSNGKSYNKSTGVSNEVYAFTSEEEIKAMVDVFNKHINEAPDENKRQIAYRNKMLFLIGINLSLRISDLVTLKWNFFLNNDLTFKDFYKVQPKKTKKTGKFVTVYFNEAVKKMILEYINQYPIEDMNDFVFKSRKGNGAITEGNAWRIISGTAEEIGIERNIGTHSLRKTFGRFVWKDAEDKEQALVILMTIFNHSSVAITKRYIGLTDDEIEATFMELNLGLDFLNE